MFDLIPIRESCAIKTCLCCGHCSVLTAIRIVFTFSFICALLEIAVGICIIIAGVSSDENNSIKTKLSLLGVAIILSQCSRIFVLIWWMSSSSKEESIESRTAASCCTCFSMIILLGLSLLIAGFIAIAASLHHHKNKGNHNNNEYFQTDGLFIYIFMAIVLFDICFSIIFGLSIAKLPPQSRVNYISEKNSVISIAETQNA